MESFSAIVTSQLFVDVLFFAIGAFFAWVTAIARPVLDQVKPTLAVAAPVVQAASPLIEAGVKQLLEAMDLKIIERIGYESLKQLALDAYADIQADGSMNSELFSQIYDLALEQFDARKLEQRMLTRE
jgi:hypothetical protein